VTWERYAGQDGHADERFAAPMELACWLEDRGGFGGVVRDQKLGITEYDPKTDVYMDAQQIDAAQISMRDRFTFVQNGQTFSSLPDRVSVIYGPDSSPWLVVVTT
jgi:hypothetical protein